MARTQKNKATANHLGILKVGAAAHWAPVCLAAAVAAIVLTAVRSAPLPLTPRCYPVLPLGIPSSCMRAGQASQAAARAAGALGGRRRRRSRLRLRSAERCARVVCAHTAHPPSYRRPTADQVLLLLLLPLPLLPQWATPGWASWASPRSANRRCSPKSQAPSARRQATVRCTALMRCDGLMRGCWGDEWGCGGRRKGGGGRRRDAGLSPCCPR